jgi:hypothetical protein
MATQKVEIENTTHHKPNITKNNDEGKRMFFELGRLICLILIFLSTVTQLFDESIYSSATSKGNYINTYIVLFVFCFLLTLFYTISFYSKMTKCHKCKIDFYFFSYFTVYFFVVSIILIVSKNFSSDDSMNNVVYFIRGISIITLAVDIAMIMVKFSKDYSITKKND